MYDTLADNNCVIDFGSKPLSIEILKEFVYSTYRNREASGVDCNVMDLMVSDRNSDLLAIEFIADMQSKYGKECANPYLSDKSGNPLKYLSVDIPECGCVIAIIPSEQLGFKMKDDQLWAIDLSDITGHPPKPMNPNRHLIIENFKGFTK